MTLGKVILVRHGETDWNQERRFQGQSDPELNENGEIQAQEAAALLSGENIDLVFSSDMIRARATAAVIAGLHHAPVIIDSSLREMNFGDWEGRTFADVKNRYPELLNKWLENSFETRIPGGETAEEVNSRVIKAWANISAAASERDTVAVVAHGGSLRLLLCHLTGIDSSRHWDFIIGHGEAVVLIKNGGAYSIQLSMKGETGDA